MFPSLNAIEIQNPVIETETHQESDDLFQAATSRQSPSFSVAPIQRDWNQLVVSALEVANNVNPYSPDLPVGTVIRAIDAVGWSGPGHRNCDIRPRLVDKTTGEVRLLDSGSQITVTKKKPGDKKDDKISLIAVNGTKID